MTKGIALAVALAASVAMLSGCAAFESIGKNVESNTVKLHRVVSLYDYDGELMRTWEGDMRIESESSQQCSFILDGERTSINGGIVVVQEVGKEKAE